MNIAESTWKFMICFHVDSAMSLTVPTPVRGPDRVGSGCRTLLYTMKIKSIHKFSSFDSVFFFFTLTFIMTLTHFLLLLNIHNTFKL